MGLFGIKLPKIDVGNIGGLLGVASNFVPGLAPFAAGASALGGMLEGGKAQRNADRSAASAKAAMEEAQANERYRMELFRKYSSPLFERMYSGDFASTDPGALARPGMEVTGLDNNRAVDSIFNDFAMRGIRGGSGMASAVAGARQRGQSDANRLRVGAQAEARAADRNWMMGLASNLNGLGGSSGMLDVSRGMAGLGGMYQSQADSFAPALETLGETIGTMVPKKAARPADAGNNTLNTNNARRPAGPTSGMYVPTPGSFQVNPKPGPFTAPQSTLHKARRR